MTASSDSVETLRRIRGFAQVFTYLSAERGWPLDVDDLTEEDLKALTYDWEADELGIPPDSISRLERLRQMRPVTAGQPWGVFFLEFAGSRLPITQVRRILQALVTKRRASSDGGRPSWPLEDLLFFVVTGAASTMELHLLAFRGDTSQKADIRSLSWRPNSPPGHLRRLAVELLPCLDWPEDDRDIESWRTSWREAFKLPLGQDLVDASRLAERMARTARDLRDQIAAALAAEQGSGPFSGLVEEIRKQLVSDVNDERFADMCAQTLTYGVLSSRVTDPEGFGSSPILSSVPLANPFLEAFFEQVHDQAVSLDLTGSGLPQLVADLRKTNVEAILDQFGSTAKGGDPVIHFYEEFLKRYDAKLRADSGAFYTPQPVVEFMVRMVDEVLRSRFGMPMGIADSATWQDVADRTGFEVPVGVDPGKPFVSMIDPATGTGTFLVEWLRRAHVSFLASGEPSDWQEYLRTRVLPSMHAFESMLAPYTIAHLKVALELHHAGASGGATRILLTDALEHRPIQGQFGTMLDPIAAEGKRAADLKESERFTVVIGNPPYDREQRDFSNAEKRKGGVARYGSPGIPPLILAVTEPMRLAGRGRSLVNVYNDYIYFWCWAVWQASQLPSGPGIVAFVTASSFLDGKSMGGVRQMLREAFDEIRVVDIGGEGRGSRTEKNIFDIQTPVTITVGIRSVEQKTHQCAVYYRRISGSRNAKLVQLDQVELDHGYTEIPGDGLDDFTPRSQSRYYDYPLLTDLFPWHHSGCKVHRTWPIAETTGLLERRWSALVAEIPRKRGELLKETADRAATSRLRPLLGGRSKLRPVYELDQHDLPEAIDRYGLRNFDRAWLIADNRIIDRGRADLWRVRSPKQVFLITRISSKLGRGLALSAMPYVPDVNSFGDRGTHTIPLFRDCDARQPNVTAGLVDHLSEQLGSVVDEHDLVAYVYAISGTGAFGNRFDDETGRSRGGDTRANHRRSFALPAGRRIGSRPALVAHLG